MTVIAETSQDPIGPCEPLEQSMEDSLRHSLMAAWSSVFDLGANTVVAAVVVYIMHRWMGHVARWVMCQISH